MLPSAVSNQQQPQSAFATFPGENGKIAFVKNIGGVNYDIYVMNSNGSEQTRLTDNPANDFYPDWSPDGTKIVFWSDRDGTNNGEIYIMNPDGSEQTRLTDNPTIDTTPDWSPNGESIIFRRGFESQNPEIYVMNADGTGQTNISNNPAIDFDPTWSPAKIVFWSDRDGTNNGEIYIMNPDGSEQTNISNYPGRTDGHPDWGTATDQSSEDITPPGLTVPEDMVVEATSEQGAEVMYNVSAEDDVDGAAILEEDNTLSQDDVGGAIDISCDPPSGSEFPIGETIVDCTATDAAGNVAGPESFTVTVNPPPPPPPTPTTPRELIEKLITDIENLEGFPEGAKTRIVALLERVLVLLSDDNTRNDASACNMLGGAFMNQVNANERQDTLTEDQAGDLRTQAQDIRNELDC
jgi:hypothetical protein